LDWEVYIVHGEALDVPVGTGYIERRGGQRSSYEASNELRFVDLVVRRVVLYHSRDQKRNNYRKSKKLADLQPRKSRTSSDRQQSPTRPYPPPYVRASTHSPRESLMSCPVAIARTVIAALREVSLSVLRRGGRGGASIVTCTVSVVACAECCCWWPGGHFSSCDAGGGSGGGEAWSLCIRGLAATEWSPSGHHDIRGQDSRRHERGNTLRAGPCTCRRC
jgi:hypothetical protein